MSTVGILKVRKKTPPGQHEFSAKDDLDVMQRSGAGDQTGLVFVLNNRGSWNGAWIQTRWNNTQLFPMAWRGRDDLSSPEAKWTNESGWVNLWAPARGYAVYVPE